jgi:hypothetical protein
LYRQRRCRYRFWQECECFADLGKSMAKMEGDCKVFLRILEGYRSNSSNRIQSLCPNAHGAALSLKWHVTDDEENLTSRRNKYPSRPEKHHPPACFTPYHCSPERHHSTDSLAQSNIFSITSAHRPAGRISVQRARHVSAGDGVGAVQAHFGSSLGLLDAMPALRGKSRQWLRP